MAMCDENNNIKHSDLLQIQFQVLFEINKTEISQNFTKAPFYTLSYTGHGLVKMFLVWSEMWSRKRVYKGGPQWVGWITIKTIVP